MKIPFGFTFAGMTAGIKVKRPDLALVLSELPAVAAGCFTQSKSRAPCVDWNQKRLPRTDARAIVANSGNANCLAGAEGEEANAQMAGSVAAALGVPVDAVLTCSTGVIGVPLPVAKVSAAMPDLVARLGPDPLPTAEAIMTTDTCTKMASREIFLGGDRVRITGIGKGSGMIHPNMATMLAFILTDAAIDAEVLDAMLRATVDDTFNMVSVDRDTSTNDQVLVLANGMAENDPITRRDSPEGELFAAALAEVCQELTRAIAGDGEGAQHLVTVTVRGAESRDAARALARAVTESNLSKAAFFGTDPNWGRVLAAIGARAAEGGHRFVPAEASVKLQGVAVFEHGKPLPFDADALRALLRGDEVFVDVTVGAGAFEATAWGCDLSYDYVRINADYAAVLVDPEGPVRRDNRLDNKTPELKADTLVQALRYIERFAGTRAVVKYGGAAMVRADLKDRFAEDVRLLQAVGLRPIIVHGGGPEISRTLEQMGQTSEFIDGLRVTDAASLRVVEMVLTGQINKEVVSSLARAGAKAVGLSGKDGGLIEARKLQAPSGRDLGYVGEVAGVNPEVIELLVGKGFIPVVSPIGLGRDGHTYNINADTVAAELAVACGARKLIFLTDVAGILAKGLLVSEMSAEELELRMNDGTVTGGMLPKAQAILRALHGGVETVHIIDGRVPHNVVAELFTSRGVGTMIRAGAPKEGEEVPMG
ncbi:bifunctional glutamate N-acetyltransferase/amino-acid acetyltransferase ArgJ [Polyangium aurulentum]|uniref:bifunctional glutamate N-acetyltransferase/amino-acid acetyltransferase ArgJ n=1 Tax=Polyangium aurulentum TaxID=2567896 RepID=UPI0010AECD39|nr:bifunctional glutamate N-acetyltransferase/amino-acid acetyltransferase ArgJ [Polyangium aurulentum]UQA61953.1 bifunctional glutamate N-acetyltransferase/amino-acid acetyltransferase ArgJ [Polyangium aurulentum]